MLTEKQVASTADNLRFATLEQLKHISDVLQKTWEQKREHRIQEVKNNISEGDIVRLKGTDGKNVGVLEKIKRTRAIVIIDDQKWDVSLLNIDTSFDYNEWLND